MLAFFKVDGMIYHDAKTCPNNSNCRYGMPQRLRRTTGMPSLIINGDLNDLRLSPTNRPRPTSRRSSSSSKNEGLTPRGS